MTSTTETVYNEHIKICECKDFQLSSCTDCKSLLDIFKPTQTELDLLKHQKKTLKDDQRQSQKEIENLNQTIQKRREGIQETQRAIESMKHDLNILQSKCKDEVIQVEEIQKSKETVKRELEELNQRLFEEADRMISAERIEQDKIRQASQDLEQALERAQNDCQNVFEQLLRLKGQMKRGSHPKPDAYCRAQLDILGTHGFICPLQTEPDTLALIGLGDFLQLASQTPLGKLHSLKYMKCCLREDIEPCLRFGPSPRLASKKIVDAILVKTCFIEECPEGFVERQSNQKVKEATATLWERFTTNPVFSGCQACGRRVKGEERKAVLKYRFRISYFDEWACVDRYCRDRLVAVIEFYSLIRHIRIGVYKHQTLLELYQQMSRLRLQMFLARMGALPYLLSSCHMDTQKVGTAFHGQEYSLPYLDSTNERLSSSTDSTITSISTVSSFVSH
ncbi:unnamed protein product [Rhizopus stolonifer]